MPNRGRYNKRMVVNMIDQFIILKKEDPNLAVKIFTETVCENCSCKEK